LVIASTALAFGTVVAAASADVSAGIIDPPAPPVAQPGPSKALAAGLVVTYSNKVLVSASGARAAGADGDFRISSTEDNEYGVVSFEAPLPVAQAQVRANELAKQPGVATVELDLLATPSAAPPGGVPNDLYFNLLHGVWDQRAEADTYWGKVKLPAGGYSTKAPSLWRLTEGSAKVVVAVLDTGSTPHPDLDANTVRGYDFISESWRARDGNGRDSNPNDEGDWTDGSRCDAYGNSSWHGTHVAGTVAAIRNSHGVIGNAPGVKLQHVRVLGHCGGTFVDIADGITWASGGKVKGVAKNKTPAKVLNLSIQTAGGKCPSVLQKAINGARKRGSVVIAAAGNYNQNASTSSPGNCKNVITVGASDFLGARAPYSNSGKAVDLSAPGGAMGGGTGEYAKYSADGSDAILSTINTGTRGQGSAAYAYYQGTSMATPGVAGVAALIASLRPKITAAQLEYALRSSVTKFPNRSFAGARNCSGKSTCGKGVIDASRAATSFLAAPKVTNAQVGKKAKANVRAVSTKSKFKYQWLRNGKKIKGATKATYAVKKADLGKKLSVKVTASLSGFPSRSATTKRVKVVKQTPSVGIKLKSKSIKRSQKAKVTITVKAGSITKKPAGKLKLTYGKSSRTYTLKAAKKGKLIVTLPKLKKGTYKIKVKYTPAGKTLKKYVKAKGSKTLTLKVK